MARKIVFKTLGTDPKDISDQVKAGKMTREEAQAKLNKLDPLIDYRDQMLNALARPTDQQRGFVGKEMHSVIALMDKIEKALGKQIVLEDAEHSLLNKHVQAYPWAMAHANIGAFLNDVDEAEKVDLNDTKATPAAGKRK